MSVEHDHVITVTHLRNDAARVECECGDRFAGGPGVVLAWIRSHRRRHFPRFRA